MKQLGIVLIGAAISLGVATPAAAQRNHPITVEVGAPAGISDVTGGSGVYYTLSSELVTADLRNEVNFFLDLGTSRSESERSLCVDLSQPTSGVPRGVVCADMHWNTSDAGSLTSLQPEQWVDKRMQLFWTTAAGTYYLRWGNDSLTNWVTVTCRATAPTGCVDWTIANPAGQARLTLSTRKGVTELGTYLVPVQMRVMLR